MEDPPLKINPADGWVTEFPQFLFVDTLEEEINLDLRETGETPDEYWARGWNLRYCDAIRANFSDYKGWYCKTFPARCWLADFRFSKSMRRVLARNADLKRVTRPLRITPAKESLFLEHAFYRFKEMPRESLSKSYKYIVDHQASYMETCFFDGERLVAFCIFEVGVAAIFSHVGVWSPKYASRGMGTLTMLAEVEMAREMGCYYYYIGPFNPYNPAYTYKFRLPGLELYDWDNDNWVKRDAAFIEELLQQKLPAAD